jgi:hypothetical protein
VLGGNQDFAEIDAVVIREWVKLVQRGIDEARGIDVEVCQHATFEQQACPFDPRHPNPVGFLLYQARKLPLVLCTTGNAAADVEGRAPVRPEKIQRELAVRFQQLVGVARRTHVDGHDGTIPQRAHATPRNRHRIGTLDAADQDRPLLVEQVKGANAKLGRKDFAHGGAKVPQAGPAHPASLLTIPWFTWTPRRSVADSPSLPAVANECNKSRRFMPPLTPSCRQHSKSAGLAIWILQIWLLAACTQAAPAREQGSSGTRQAARPTLAWTDAADSGGIPSGGYANETGGAAGVAGDAAQAGYAGSATAQACPGLTSGIVAAKTIYVAPDGQPINAGTSFESPVDLATALAQVAPGEMILLRPATYRIGYAEGVKNTIVLDQSGESGRPIYLVAAECGRARFDFSFPELAWVQNSFGFQLTASYWHIQGVEVTHAGYQGMYVTGQHNTIENCAFFDNRNTGLEINKGGAYTTVVNCDSYRNYDPKKLGSMADGFGPKETQGPGNRFVGCRAWENSDDGFDAYDSPEAVLFEDCWAFRNGIDVWHYEGFSGNGNGFKVGGNFKQANHRLSRSIAFGNRVKGFDQNNNTGGLVLYNCTAYANGINFGLSNGLNSGELHELKNNASWGAVDDIRLALSENNTWDLAIALGEDDFASLETNLATAERTITGQIPRTQLFRPSAASQLVDRGVDVGAPFNGNAPDLGAFESGQ